MKLLCFTLSFFAAAQIQHAADTEGSFSSHLPKQTIAHASTSGLKQLLEQWSTSISLPALLRQLDDRKPTADTSEKTQPSPWALLLEADATLAVVDEDSAKLATLLHLLNGKPTPGPLPTLLLAVQASQPAQWLEEVLAPLAAAPQQDSLQQKETTLATFLPDTSWAEPWRSRQVRVQYGILFRHAVVILSEQPVELVFTERAAPRLRPHSFLSIQSDEGMKDYSGTAELCWQEGLQLYLRGHLREHGSTFSHWLQTSSPLRSLFRPVESENQAGTLRLRLALQPQRRFD